jgi:hypothetical protein
MAYEYNVDLRGAPVLVTSETPLDDEQQFLKAIKLKREQDRQAQQVQTVEQPKERTFGEALASGVIRYPLSTLQLGAETIGALRQPVELIKGLHKLSRGLVQKALPDNIVDFLGRDEMGDQVVDAVSEHYVNKYGSVEAFKEAVATHPAEIVADVSTVLMGGGGILRQLPAFQKVGTKMQAVGETIEPISSLTKTVAPVVGSTTQAISGTLTGTGTEPLKQAFRAGEAGGEKSALFTSNLRGTANPTDIVDTARQALTDMRMRASENYKLNMAEVSKDATVLDLTDTFNAIQNSFNKFAAFKGQIKNESVAAALKAVQAKVDDWAKLNPAEFHTPEGLDQLKQSVGEILMGLPAENRTAYAAVKNVYDEIKKSVAKQAPDYAKAMDDYSKSSDLLFEMERALSLGNNKLADTALRKLSSIMRNNVNTNYGERLRLGSMLDEASDGTLFPMIAGQQMSSWMPRGIQSATQPLAVLQGANIAGLPAAATMALASSPRVAGEVAHAMGQASGAVQRAGGSKIAEMTAPYRQPEVYNALYQLGLLGNVEERSK